MNIKTKLTSLLLCGLSAITLQAAVIDYVPSPDDQGGMIMPMVSLGASSISIMPMSLPVPTLQTLNEFAGFEGDEFDPADSWYPTLNTSNGTAQRFNSRYGFMFMDAGMMDEPPSPYLPPGNSIALRLVSKSAGIKVWNYGKADNRFDLVMDTPGSQVLWDGTMWHPVITLDNAADAAMTYSLTFEAFVADTNFTAGTGFVDYSAAALAAGENSSFTPAQYTLTWTASPIPEPSFTSLLLISSLFFASRKKLAIKR
ncbi:MAG: hypothetical protein ACK5LK_05785 [Chthoniobacterales bacterium]